MIDSKRPYAPFGKFIWEWWFGDILTDAYDNGTASLVDFEDFYEYTVCIIQFHGYIYDISL